LICTTKVGARYQQIRFDAVVWLREALCSIEKLFPPFLVDKHLTEKKYRAAPPDVSQTAAVQKGDMKSRKKASDGRKIF
jgi:hypothetical protein